MSPRADVSSERKAQILDAATTVFARNGFDEASMDQVVAESGLSKGALYWYFKSKDQIIAALFERIFVAELKQLRDLTDAPGPARDRLLEFAWATARQMKHLTRLLPIAYEFYSLAFRNKTVKKAIRLYLQRYSESLIPLIEQGIANGEFRAMDAQTVAIAIGAAVEGTFLLWVFDPKLVSFETQMVTGIELILDGLRVFPTPTERSKEPHAK